MMRVAVIVGGMLLATSVVRGHHSYAGFHDPAERTVAVEGSLQDIQYANPHVILSIRAADASLYTVTWQSMGWVRQYAKVESTTFTVGDELVVIGAPSRDPRSREVTQVREVRRPRDGWVWRADEPFAAPR